MVISQLLPLKNIHSIIRIISKCEIICYLSPCLHATKLRLKLPVIVTIPPVQSAHDEIQSWGKCNAKDSSLNHVKIFSYTVFLVEQSVFVIPSPLRKEIQRRNKKVFGDNLLCGTQACCWSFMSAEAGLLSSCDFVQHFIHLVLQLPCYLRFFFSVNLTRCLEVSGHCPTFSLHICFDHWLITQRCSSIKRSWENISSSSNWNLRHDINFSCKIT